MDVDELEIVYGPPDHTEEVFDLWVVGYDGKATALHFFREVGLYDQPEEEPFVAKPPVQVVGLAKAVEALERVPFCYARWALKHPSKFAGQTCGPHHYGGSMARLEEDEITKWLEICGLKYELRPRTVTVPSPWRS